MYMYMYIRTCMHVYYVCIIIKHTIPKKVGIPYTCTLYVTLSVK